MADESSDARTLPAFKPYRLLALVAIYFVIAHLEGVPNLVEN